MLLQVKTLTKRFGGLVAVDKLDFQVTEGEILGIMGPNGSGKTTLFNVITGVYPCTEGKVILRGEDITNLKPFRIAKSGIGRTFQRTTLFNTETVLDNLIISHKLRTKVSVLGAVFGSHYYRAQERKCRDKAQEMLEFVGLVDEQNMVASHLTQEAQKRLSIAMALATEPKLLLCDEPTAGVNLDEIEKFASLIKKIRNLGCSICLIEHKMRMLMSLSDRVMVLNHGQKIAEGSPGEIASDKGVIEAYLGSGYVT